MVRRLRCLVFVLACLPMLPSRAAAPPGLQTLVRFDGGDGCARGADGLDRGGLTFDSSGVAYGTTLFGGTLGGGALFRLEPGGVYSVLYDFPAAEDGFVEPESGLALGSGGRLYGTTITGGDAGAGSVFRYDIATKRYRDIYSFRGRGDGERPNGSLTWGKDGALYGTTQAGGAAGGGTLFRVDPLSGAHRTLYAFGAGESAGMLPLAGVQVDRAGRLLGSLNEGGRFEGGQIFRFDATSGQLDVLHEFRGRLGIGPTGGLALDSGGIVYGITEFGGLAGVGVVFRLDPRNRDYLVLHSFLGGSVDGAEPRSLGYDRDAMLYGVTRLGGAAGLGTLFSLTLPTAGYAVLANFAGGRAGGEPADQPSFHAGRLYGMTTVGGAKPGFHGCGTIFRSAP